MNSKSRIWIGLKALSELGAAQVGLYGLYQLGLRTGHYQRLSSAALARLAKLDQPHYLSLHPCLPGLPGKDTLQALLGDQVEELYKQAGEIVAGRVRLFGGEPVPLVLSLPMPLENWTRYEGDANRPDGQDIKLIWEPARFGWACTLARAYYLSGDEKYAENFWEHTGHFFATNPPYLGPHWASAQEVAVRLVALAFAYQVFSRSSRTTPASAAYLARSIAIHAERIPPSMVYARSQNNNHLVTEALGLYTASILLAGHPLAARWHSLGWKWLMNAFQTQIAPDGAYTQHSTNYHRLMLQAALWAFAVYHQSSNPGRIPPGVTARLASSTRWLSNLVDSQTGRVPNLGHNDGAYILPLSVCPYDDYRPVLHAALQAFMGTSTLPEGAWSEMSHWLGSSQWQIKSTGKIDPSPKDASRPTPLEPPYVLASPASDSWAVLNVAHFRSRPAHCDQLHLDLWWRGLNLALDPGTYHYNAPPPWENSLSSAFVHNTVTVDGHEFMQRAGRFLYLDWAQAKVLDARAASESNSRSITASHNGYRKLGILHTRTVTACEDGHWEVTDRLDGPPVQTHTIRLHWLLPDWEVEVAEASDQAHRAPVIRIRSPYGWVSLAMQVIALEFKQPPSPKMDFRLARAGQLIHGDGQVDPIAGWTSPTYGCKIPALACILEVTQPLPVELKSDWVFPDEA